MFEARWKNDYREYIMGAMKEKHIEIQERVFEEVEKGFDSRDERHEVFLEIADEFDVSPDVIWDIYRNGRLEATLRSEGWK